MSQMLHHHYTFSPDEWHSYFNNLLSVRVEECDYEIGIATLKNNFDEHITVKEVTNAIRTLRNNTCVVKYEI